MYPGVSLGCMPNAWTNLVLAKTFPLTVSHLSTSIYVLKRSDWLPSVYFILIPSIPTSFSLLYRSIRLMLVFKGTFMDSFGYSKEFVSSHLRFVGVQSFLFTNFFAFFTICYCWEEILSYITAIIVVGSASLTSLCTFCESMSSLEAKSRPRLLSQLLDSSSSFSLISSLVSASIRFKAS